MAVVVGEELEGRGPEVAVARRLPPLPISSPRRQTAAVPLCRPPRLLM